MEHTSLKNKMTAQEATNILVEKLKLDYTGLTEEEKTSLNRAVNVAFIALANEKYWNKVLAVLSEYLGKKISAESAMEKIERIYLLKNYDEHQMRT